MRRGFTLMEVNLAILVMAGGILAMVSLYSFGYRENRQSREDVGGAALADAVLSPMIMAASASAIFMSASFRTSADEAARTGETVFMFLTLSLIFI